MRGRRREEARWRGRTGGARQQATEVARGAHSAAKEVATAHLARTRARAVHTSRETGELVESGGIFVDAGKVRARVERRGV